jgi:hypothetical protein
MEAGMEKLFVDFDLFYPSQNTGFTIWGKHGTILLNNIKAIVNPLLEREGYAEISLPSVFKKSCFERYIGSEAKNKLLVDVLYGQEGDLVLKPFSELIYADFLAQKVGSSKKATVYEKVFQWGLCFLNEIHPDLCINGNEIKKCEIFSIHNEYTAANTSWRKLNKLLQKICVDDFRMSPLYGYRPGVSAFPSSLDTFSAEIGLGHGDFQTLMVSHIMDSNFLSKCGFQQFADCFLCSACFSQKMIAASVLHHKDKYGFRYPSKLAPVLGIIACKGQVDSNICGERIIILQKADGWESEELSKEIVNRGAVWLIFENDAEHEGSRWNILRRGNMEEDPIEVDSLDKAIDATKEYIKEYDGILLEDSIKKVSNSMVMIDSFKQFREINGVVDLEVRPNIFVPCCACNNCMEEVVSRIQWIPKLIYRHSHKKCIHCGKDTEQGIMFEYSEMYTSFYVKRKEQNE